MRPRTWPASLVPVIVGLAVAAALGRDRRRSSRSRRCVSRSRCRSRPTSPTTTGTTSRGIDHGERLGPRACHAVRVARARRGAARGVRCRSRWRVLAGLPLVCARRRADRYHRRCLDDRRGRVQGGPFPLASHGLGELLAFVFFGLVAVSGTAYSADSLACRFRAARRSRRWLLAAAIMSVNNLRDIPTDGPRRQAHARGAHRRCASTDALRWVVGWRFRLRRRARGVERRLAATAGGRGRTARAERNARPRRSPRSRTERQSRSHSAARVAFRRAAGCRLGRGMKLRIEIEPYRRAHETAGDGSGVLTERRGFLLGSSIPRAESAGEKRPRCIGSTTTRSMWSGSARHVQRRSVDVDGWTRSTMFARRSRC